MATLCFIHWTQFRKMLKALKKKSIWFYADTRLLTMLLMATLLTETVKLLSPVRIPHLGLWHYGMGIAMSITTYTSSGVCPLGTDCENPADSPVFQSLNPE